MITRRHCPIPGCDWYSEQRFPHLLPPAELEAVLQTHLEAHDLTEWVRATVTLRTELTQARRHAVAHRDRALRKARRAGAALQDAARLRRIGRELLAGTTQSEWEHHHYELEEAIDWWKHH